MRHYGQRGPKIPPISSFLHRGLPKLPEDGAKQWRHWLVAASLGQTPSARAEAASSVSAAMDLI